MATTITEISSNKIFEGFQKVFSHDSNVLGCKMKFGVYLPPHNKCSKLPVIYWLSGLECSEANFIQKSGMQRYASENGVIIVNPDTSPRGPNVPDDTESWDFGVAASFYLNATQEPWKKNYQMFSYVTEELVSVINNNFPVLPEKMSIMGHSMGGHGALICALKKPGLYCSVSAFAPISNPINCSWGQKAFKGYLGSKESENWLEWDATELAKSYQGPPLEIFIDQGANDKFYVENQLLPENLVKTIKNHDNLSIVFKLRDGYDHSYYYVASFIGEHIKYHTKFF